MALQSINTLTIDINTCLAISIGNLSIKIYHIWSLMTQDKQLKFQMYHHYKNNQESVFPVTIPVIWAFDALYSVIKYNSVWTPTAKYFGVRIHKAVWG